MADTANDCGFAAAIRMLEGKWKLDILCELHTGARRFGRLRRAIQAISEKMLAQKLRELEADGLIHRKVYEQMPAKVVYSLSERGAGLIASSAALCRWGEQLGLSEPVPAACAVPSLRA
ncbi:helix-turn-helix transcriptional regulator [Labrys sp. KNU-23]|uniref:winged helix-turn-helix transcriptional regulator n=1 Tax=Labrys sp. KNU-23 TaxID=2789216 RepID=UPI0011ED3D97|nr:helix-turn-helix domain-containing protein [Labrys sp. KNU-23]QEN88015.1 helix-turn-helix transcriptional regulator [Labrys sp. KNU-23]